MKFSDRTNWHRQPNKLSDLFEHLHKDGKPILDLTVSNPTECGIEYPEKEILATLTNSSSLHYEPNPQGILIAREVVSGYYKKKNIVVDPSNIFLTASTSEACSILFKLLCNAGDGVLVPKPSYPLFDYLAQLNDVQLQYYKLRYDGEWHIDIDSFAPKAQQPPAENNLKIENIEKIKAIVIVNPHNPTGMLLNRSEYESIKEFARQHDLALIVDEVFIDYAFEKDKNRIESTANEKDILTFTLNGISKSCGLPQMKLGWIIVGGESFIVSEAVARLEIICDIFLSVNTPVQVALPELLKMGEDIRENILARIRTNYSILQKETLNTPCSALTANGGWYGILRVPRTKSDEEWALQLLEKKGVYVYPGYFFDFMDDGYIVVSLLTECSVFQKTVREIVDFISMS